MPKDHSDAHHRPKRDLPNTIREEPKPDHLDGLHLTHNGKASTSIPFLVGKGKSVELSKAENLARIW